MALPRLDRRQSAAARPTGWPKRRSWPAALIAAWSSATLLAGAGLVRAQEFRAGASDPLTGPRSPLVKDWIGLRPVPSNTPILLLAGHADAQGIGGSGTSGAAVALRGAAPMYPGISDEHYWALVIVQAVESLGQRRGLAIRSHQPPLRTIVDGDAPGTNWSAGRLHAAAGGYALELHFDAYGPDGVGSGLIPALHAPFSQLDETLAAEFGAYPMNFRDQLGGPKRGISLLEIGKLEGLLEASLRDPARRNPTVQTIAERIVTALERGLGRRPTATGLAAGPKLTPPPGGAGNVRPEPRLQASSGGE